MSIALLDSMFQLLLCSLFNYMAFHALNVLSFQVEHYYGWSLEALGEDLELGSRPITIGHAWSCRFASGDKMGSEESFLTCLLMLAGETASAVRTEDEVSKCARGAGCAFCAC